MPTMQTMSDWIYRQDREANIMESLLNIKHCKKLYIRYPYITRCLLQHCKFLWAEQMNKFRRLKKFFFITYGLVYPPSEYIFFLWITRWIQLKDRNFCFSKEIEYKKLPKTTTGYTVPSIYKMFVICYLYISIYIFCQCQEEQEMRNKIIHILTEGQTLSGCKTELLCNRATRIAAFKGMHGSPMKHSYVWLPRKCDYRKDTQTDGQTDTG